MLNSSSVSGMWMLVDSTQTELQCYCVLMGDSCFNQLNHNSGVLYSVRSQQETCRRLIFKSRQALFALASFLKTITMFAVVIETSYSHEQLFAMEARNSFNRNHKLVQGDMWVVCLDQLKDVGEKTSTRGRKKSGRTHPIHDGTNCHH